MIAWMEKELLLVVVLLVSNSNWKSKLINLQHHKVQQEDHFRDEKLRPIGRLFWDGGSTIMLDEYIKELVGWCAYVMFNTTLPLSINGLKIFVIAMLYWRWAPPNLPLPFNRHLQFSVHFQNQLMYLCGWN